MDPLTWDDTTPRKHHTIMSMQRERIRAELAAARKRQREREAQLVEPLELSSTPNIAHVEPDMENVTQWAQHRSQTGQ